MKLCQGLSGHLLPSCSATMLRHAPTLSTPLLGLVPKTNFPTLALSPRGPSSGACAPSSHPVPTLPPTLRGTLRWVISPTQASALGPGSTFHLSTISLDPCCTHPRGQELGTRKALICPLFTVYWRWQK